MYIPKECSRIIKAGKEAQSDYQCYFYVDPDSLAVYHLPNWDSQTVSKALSQAPHSSLKIKKTALKPSIGFLIDEGLLKKAPGGSSYQVTYRGWHHNSVHAREVSKLLLTHVAFPSFVALLTTVLIKCLNLV